MNDNVLKDMENYVNLDVSKDSNNKINKLTFNGFKNNFDTIFYKEKYV